MHAYGSKKENKTKFQNETKGRDVLKEVQSFAASGEVMPYMEQNTALWARILDEIST